MVGATRLSGCASDEIIHCMMTLEDFVEAAFPHEAGHALIGRTLGLPIHSIDHIVLGIDGNLSPGNFATKGPRPEDEDILKMPMKVKAAYMLYVAGGLAGNLFARVPVDEHGIEVDRSELARVTTMTLEQVATEAQVHLAKHKEPFERLTAAIKDKYEALMSDENTTEGRHTLLTIKEIDELLKNAPDKSGRSG